MELDDRDESVSVETGIIPGYGVGSIPIGATRASLPGLHQSSSPCPISGARVAKLENVWVWSGVESDYVEQIMVHGAFAGSILGWVRLGDHLVQVRDRMGPLRAHADEYVYLLRKHPGIAFQVAPLPGDWRHLMGSVQEQLLQPGRKAPSSVDRNEAIWESLPDYEVADLTSERARLLKEEKPSGASMGTVLSSNDFRQLAIVSLCPVRAIYVFAARSEPVICPIDALAREGAL